ncbi:Rsm22-domain-containing protein [Fomitiporia mediterranea MF3/22]|uniref:Rsm22-domain-containing protein n=1 Tax=Fomitiporia mediterranea (strain MF3/22) TaxID=694068 RepID=UPI0004407C57|nr:Rsm22-domain-containing protein [Fomitiporia mediterranea MF3/22]EJD03728.1 Rsm22-domain-containing protein [Fomitiporia mediterranea MF3/22]
MLSGQCRVATRLCCRRSAFNAAKLSSSPRLSSHGPNAPLELDPSLQDLLRDADMALLKHKPSEPAKNGSSSAKELEILEFDESSTERTEDGENDIVTPKERKSARAAFGSRGIGSVFLPMELREAIEKVIGGGDKPRLHEDAKRLFREDGDNGGDLWHTNYQTDYKSWKQTQRHEERDGTAFASVALPAHYSAVYAVFDHIKHRLGDDWKVRNIIDWGSGVGSGLWASMHAFQEGSEEQDGNTALEPSLSRSIITSYLGFEKRKGLSNMAKRLIEDSNVGSASVRWHKAYSKDEQIQRSEGGDVLALSAFHLSSLPTPAARKEMVKQMWSSGAEVIVLIDHDTSTGFTSIIEARDQLLRMGKRELQDSEIQGDPMTGCHVVAPCPHDGACPLFNSGKPSLKCTFSQRLQRPAFLRKTKHVRAGHEDMGYSYVVIRRGQRPSKPRIGETSDTSGQNIATDAESASSIRLEAYDWPRMVFPPLKRSGHVIIDGCTAEGKIMRMTIPRSQGKQPYYDARKSSWGDIFPHKPKNPPQIRYEPNDSTTDPSSLPGSDIGKRRVKEKKQDPTSYEKIYADLREIQKSRQKMWDRLFVAIEEEV